MSKPVSLRELMERGCFLCGVRIIPQFISTMAGVKRHPGDFNFLPDCSVAPGMAGVVLLCHGCAQARPQRSTPQDVEAMLRDPATLPEDPEELRKLVTDIFESPEEAKQRALDMVRTVAASHGLPPPEEVEKKIDVLRAQGFEGAELDAAIDRMAENDHREAAEKASPCSCRDNHEDPMRKKMCPLHGVAPWLKCTWPVGERL